MQAPRYHCTADAYAAPAPAVIPLEDFDWTLVMGVVVAVGIADVAEPCEILAVDDTAAPFDDGNVASKLVIGEVY
jgi:hypothetical protein